MGSAKVVVICLSVFHPCSALSLLTEMWPLCSTVKKENGDSKPLFASQRNRPSCCVMVLTCLRRASEKELVNSNRLPAPLNQRDALNRSCVSLVPCQGRNWQNNSFPLRESNTLSPTYSNQRIWSALMYATHMMFIIGTCPDVFLFWCSKQLCSSVGVRVRLLSLSTINFTSHCQVLRCRVPSESS